MYGGYRDVKKSEENSSSSGASSVPNSAPISANRLRGLRCLPNVSTVPVRTKHLLEGLREVYDDIDNSASNHRPVQPPEDDPLISWDKHSLPKGLEWMKPTPSKTKTLNANTIPETVNNFSSRNNNHSKAGLLATDEPQNLQSSGNADTAKKIVGDAMQLDNNHAEHTPPVILNETDKENVFLALQSKNELHLPRDKFLSSKQPSEVRSEKEDIFTPLKRGRSDSTPATTKLLSIHPPSKISASVIPENAILDDEVSPPDHCHYNFQSGKKSPQPLNMQPHLSLLTPITRVRPSNNTPSASKRPFSASALLEKQHSSHGDNLDPWMTPARGYSQVNTHYQEAKSGKSFGQMSYGVQLGEKTKAEESGVKAADSNNPLNTLSTASSILKNTEERNPIPKMTPFSKSTQHTALNSCLITPKSFANPVPVTSARSAQRSSMEMPPPMPEVRRQPLKASPESVPYASNHSVGTNAGGNASTTEHIFVNGKPYSVLSMLGRGGSSVVYQVLDPVTSAVMAVKCVNLSELDQSTYEGYLNEISLLAQLQDSDCVIRMFDHQHCKEEKLLYVVMEKGETDLSKLIRDVIRTKKLSPAMIVYYWTEMLNAVSFIHKRGTIHSDLKPANFLLVAGRLKLIDFGIASAIQADMTSVVKDSMTGTYNYISPEALCSTGSGPDERSMRFKISYKSDVWSLGCILYNLVYGHTPFQSITHQFTKMKAIADPKHKILFPPAPGCPRALLHAMQACLVRDPKQRPSVDELMQYPYLGSIEPDANEKLAGLLERVNSVVNSSLSPTDKVLSIQCLLSATQNVKK